MTLRFIEYMDVGHSNGWRLDEVVPAEELIERSRPVVAGRAGRSGLPRRGRRPLAVCRRRRRVRGHLVGHPAVLPRLHAGPALGRGQAVHLPVRGPGPRPAGGPALGAADEELLERDRRDLVGAAPTATPSCARPRPRRCPGSRCSRWAAEPAVGRFSTGLSTAADNSWTAPRPVRLATSWITALTRHDRPPVP